MWRAGSDGKTEKEDSKLTTIETTTPRIELQRRKHRQMKNRWDQPVIGWRRNSQGVGGLHNPRGFAMLMAVLYNEGLPLYNQPVLAENPGAIVIAQIGDKIGLIQNYRMVGERILKHAGADYIQRLNSERRWDELLKKMGRWCWEAPRGLVQDEEEFTDIESFVLKTAKLEAAQEAGWQLEDLRIAGRVNANPTFFLHSQYVVHARIASIGEASPEELEIIGAMRLFTMAELRQLNMDGGFDDGLTLAAMALCGLSL